MPYLQIGEAVVYYTDEGEGQETIVFCHGLLLSGEMFEAQVKNFRANYRCITFDHRGQGKSVVTNSGYDIDTLTNDAARLIETLGVGPCHFVGLSMGGFVGLRLAIRCPELLRSLTLIGTSADPEPAHNKPRYRLMNIIARLFGIWLVVDRVMPIMFGRTFLNDTARTGDRERWRAVISSNHRLGITRAVRGVIDRYGVTDEIGRIKLPTLIIVGDEDAATPPDKSERMHAAIANSKLVIIPKAGHSTTIEQPGAVNDAIAEFLGAL